LAVVFTMSERLSASKQARQ